MRPVRTTTTTAKTKHRSDDMKRKTTAKQKPAPAKRRTSSRKPQPTPAEPAIETVLVLRLNRKGGVSPSEQAKGFAWPQSGPVEAPDWRPTKECGHGLHGWLWGEGSVVGVFGDWREDDEWRVVEVPAADIIALDGKVKFLRGVVVFCGDRLEATAYIAERAPGHAVVGGTATAGDDGTATAGDRGTATAGDGGTATAGDRGTATAGDDGTATAGDDGTATAGDRGTATAGDGGTATAGDRGTATAGDDGTATAGDDGTATAGVEGTATAGDDGTATAGDWGIVQIRFWDPAAQRYRIRTGYIGEDGLRPVVKYRLDEQGRFVEVPEAKTAEAAG